MKRNVQGLASVSAQDDSLPDGVYLVEIQAVRHQWERVRPFYTPRRLSSGNDFVAYIDAIGDLDGKHSIIDWKTSSARYPDEPQGLLALDPQLACYSWVTGEPEVAFVVFVRKRLPEIQYLGTTITDDQRHQFGDVVEETIRRIEAAHFLPRSGIRFPQNGCLSCPYVGLCLGNQNLAEAKIIRRPGGVDLGWLDELCY